VKFVTTNRLLANGSVMAKRVTQRPALRALAMVLALPLLMAGECEAPLVKDSSFDLWCGDTLCAWQVDAGTVAKAPTWHQRDYGVELVGPDTTISQLLPYGSADVSCIHFDLLAKVDASASVTLALDFDDDGVTDATQALSTGAWTPVQYRWVTPTYFQSVRMSIRKSGDGQVILARIQASKATDCPGAPPVGALQRPPGATCESALQCAAGTCRARPLGAELIGDPATPRQVCAACAADADCGAGLLCGLAFSPSFPEPYPACVAPPAATLGARCLEAAECATGVCCQGVCSTCCADAGGPACGPGETCAERPRDANGDPLRAPFQCSPAGGRAAAQAPCLADDDCASGHCTGPAQLNVCAADGRWCATVADCPTPEQNPCIALGVAGGRCD